MTALVPLTPALWVALRKGHPLQEAHLLPHWWPPALRVPWVLGLHRAGQTAEVPVGLGVLAREGRAKV